jgi:hypothetical protein
MDIRQAWMGALLLCRMYTYGNRGVWEERWAGRLLRESEILLGRWRNIGPGGKLRWMHLCTVFSNHIQVDFSCRIPCLTTIPFVIPPPSAFYILIVERPSIHVTAFPNLVRIENLATVVNIRRYSFPPTCPAHDIFPTPLRPSIQCLGVS